MEKLQIESDAELLRELNVALKTIIEDEKDTAGIPAEFFDNEYLKIRMAAKAAVLIRIKNFCTTVTMEATT